MFNIQPGQGLGFTASKEIAFGLGLSFITIQAWKEIKRFVSRVTITKSLRSKVF